MAIHIWKDGQYKSVDLARYGADGTLSGAYEWRDGAWRTLWEKASSLPVVTITGTATYDARDQFRAACITYGTTFDTVTVLPFLLDTSNVTAMRGMFQGCAALTHVPDMDTSNVTTTRDMFYGCSALTSVPPLDTSNVTNMQAMFRDCSALTHVPDMDTSNVTDMQTMFRDCSALTTAPEVDTGNVTNMAYMFRGCAALTQVPDLDTARVTNMGNTFNGCTLLTDGNVRLIGKHPSVATGNMITGSGLTREPFFNAAGQPI